MLVCDDSSIATVFELNEGYIMSQITGLASEIGHNAKMTKFDENLTVVYFE